jgi:hypothetical protein
MAQLFASWIPGNAVVPEFMGNPPLQFVPDGTGGDRVPAFSDVNGARRIDGAHFRLAGQNWFHAPIPTPAIVEDKFATLAEVIALFRIDGGKLDHVVVCEAGNDIFDATTNAFGPLAISGDHLGTLVAGANLFAVNRDRIGFGICVSLHFTADQNTVADLHRSAVGGNFNHNL